MSQKVRDFLEGKEDVARFVQRIKGTKAITEVVNE
jgi:hypothetical protein